MAAPVVSGIAALARTRWSDKDIYSSRFTGDGYQLIRVTGAVAADDPWLVTGDDAGRGASGVLLRGYTYYSDVVSLGLPHTGGGRNTLVEVPVTLANVEGLVYAAFTARFDPAVLRAVSGQTGNVTPGWSVAVNTGVSG